MSKAVFIPEQLARTASAWWGRDGVEWLDRLPGRIGDLEKRWSISVGRAFSPGGATSYVAPATFAGGGDCVLKLTIPHGEAAHEAAALRLYDGCGAVRLLGEDPEHSALLLERCRPGTPLYEEAPGPRLALGAELLRLLWRPVPAGHSFEPLADVAARWADETERRFVRFGRPFDPRIVFAGIELLRQLPLTASERVLLHQDFHAGNVLAAQRRPWLAIDPKPLVGDPAFDAVPLLLGSLDPREQSGLPGLLARRVEELASRLQLDASRIRAWAHARTVEGALWDLEVKDDLEAERGIALAALLAV